MITLAFELSASPASLALAQNETILAQCAWQTDTTGGRDLFSRLDGLLERAGVGPEKIERYAVGLGPGSYSGLRMALAAARAMALPGKQPLYGLPSPLLAARELTRTHSFPSIALVGDARRQRCWLARFACRQPGEPVMDGPIRLASWPELPDHLQGMAAVATPHWPALAPRLKSSAPATAHVWEEPAVPSAATACLLAPRLGQEDRPDAPLAPLYLHPPPPYAHAR